MTWSVLTWYQHERWRSSACISFYFWYRLSSFLDRWLDCISHKLCTLKHLNILGQVEHFGGCNWLLFRKLLFEMDHRIDAGIKASNKAYHWLWWERIFSSVWNGLSKSLFFVHYKPTWKSLGDRNFNYVSCSYKLQRTPTDVNFLFKTQELFWLCLLQCSCLDTIRQKYTCLLFFFIVLDIYLLIL